MENTASLVLSAKNIRTALIDISALLFIYLTPAISHLFSFPVYLLEPMRIMLILSLAHTSKKNAYLIALTLPLFSFLISAHPSIIKSLLITGELLFNVWLFLYLSEKIKNVFGAAAASIIVSKIAYYAVKYLLISSALITGGLISTPLMIQAVVTLVLSGYLYFVMRGQGEG
jgi:hypothetical protein